QPLHIEKIANLLEKELQEIAQAAQDLLDYGAIRSPQKNYYRSDVHNWLLWRRKQGIDDASLASSLLRYFIHEIPRDELGRMAPTLLRLLTVAGERRHLLSWARRYGDWLQRNAWQHTAFLFFQYISQL